MKAKNNVSLIIGVAIPIVMILFVAISIYVPGMFVKPTVNFLYMTGSNDAWACDYTYGVVGGKLTRIATPERPNDPGYVKYDCRPQFYVYDIATDSSKEYTFEEAQQLKLDGSPVSPDGFEVVRGGRSGGFFMIFDVGSDYDSVYLRGHNVSRKITLETANQGYYSYPDFRHLGWLLPQ